MLTHVIKCVKEPASHFYLEMTPKLTLLWQFQVLWFWSFIEESRDGLCEHVILQMSVLRPSLRQDCAIGGGSANPAWELLPPSQRVPTVPGHPLENKGISNFQGDWVASTEDPNGKVSHKDSRVTLRPTFQEHIISLQFKHCSQEPKIPTFLEPRYSSACYYSSCTLVSSTNHPSHPSAYQGLRNEKWSCDCFPALICSHYTKQQPDQEYLNMVHLWVF